MRPLFKKLFIIAISIGLIAWGSLKFSVVQDWLMDKQLTRLVQTDPDNLFDDQTDALKVLICGAGSPFSREATGPCVLVITGNTAWQFDAGNGSTLNMRKWRVPLDKTKALFITHFHSDHIADIGEMNTTSWIGGRTTPLTVYGPPGLDNIVSGFNTAYQYDRKYREEHHSKELMNPYLATMQAKTLAAGLEGVNKAIPVDDGRVKITAFVVEHAPVAPAIGYRVDYKGRSVVISGDTNKSSNLIANSLNADVLLHDALAPHMVDATTRALKAAGHNRLAKLSDDVKDYHAHTLKAAEVANAAKVKKLFFYHAVPTPPNSTAEKIFLRGVSDVRDDVELVRDGVLITLPVGSNDILVSNIAN